jgi:lysyl-tRNA synthetase class 1
MQWLNAIVDDLIERHPDGEILIESGSAPSGAYHFGHMREPLTADAILLELKRRGRQARHIHFVDDLDALRKIPINVPEAFEDYRGYPLCDIPAPDDSSQSYADFFLRDFKSANQILGLEIEYELSHEKYRSGWLGPAIERALENVPRIRHALEAISGRQLDDDYSPIQIKEGNYLKNRKFLRLDKEARLVYYEDKDGHEQPADYAKGEVKLDWRVDWPARWWLLRVVCEPSGRDHTTKGGSVDTGAMIMKEVFGAEPPLSVAYDFINLAGDTKKMSASKGTGLDAAEAVSLMPAEVMRYYILRSPASKRLYFDPVNDVVRVMDEFAALAAKSDLTDSEKQLLYISTRGVDKKTVSRVPFSLLVASYQAALKNPDRTLEIISRTEYAEVARADAEIIREELRFIDAWLEKRAPADVKFELREQIDPAEFNDAEKQYLLQLAGKIAAAPADADGDWFHKTIYEFKDTSGLQAKELFSTLYRALIGRQSGPRAGWFLGILPRDWLIKRLKLEA